MYNLMCINIFFHNFYKSGLSQIIEKFFDIFLFNFTIN